MPSKTINYPEIGDVQISKRKGSKSIRISMGHEGLVKVTMPQWTPYKVAEAFLLSKQAWLIEQKSKIHNPGFSNNERIGKNHRLVFIDTNNRKLSARLLPTQIRINIPSGYDQSSAEIQKIAKRYAVKALKEQASNLLPNRLESLATRHGFSYKAVNIKQLRSRWGSCSSDRTITLNCYLMQLPWDLIDYVLLHELVHTRIMAHGKPFWDELDKYVSNLSDKRRLIKSHKPAVLPQS